MKTILVKLNDYTTVNLAHIVRIQLRSEYVLETDSNVYDIVIHMIDGTTFLFGGRSFEAVEDANAYLQTNLYEKLYKYPDW